MKIQRGKNLIIKERNQRVQIEVEAVGGAIRIEETVAEVEVVEVGVVMIIAILIPIRIEIIKAQAEILKAKQFLQKCNLRLYEMKGQLQLLLPKVLILEP
jgi:hypothetical protein